MTTTEAVTLLKCLREALLGGKYASQYLKYEEQLAWRTVIADNVSKYIYSLDQFLTDATDYRSLPDDAGKALKLIVLEIPWSFLLSDGETTMTLCPPTKDDPDPVTMAFPDRPANAKAYHRWKLINIPASQPTEFGPPDEQGREIRP